LTGRECWRSYPRWQRAEIMDRQAVNGANAGIEPARLAAGDFESSQKE